MIVSFAHKGLSELFEKGKSSKVQPALAARALRRLDALCRLLPKRMNDPYVIANSNRVHHAERIALEQERNLEHPGAEPAHGLRNVGLPALGRDRQGGETDRPAPQGKRLEFLQGGPDP